MRVTLKILLVLFMAGIIVYGVSLLVTPPSGKPDAAELDDLPLVELPVAGADNDLLAIVLSGDGGWADLDREFGKAFQQHGVATIGFDCLKYFWKTRQPPEVAADLQRIVRYYLSTWSKRRLLLVGYSFGADWLPFLVNRLPADLQERVSLVVLLAPGDSVNLEIKAGDWLSDSVRPGAIMVLPEAQRLGPPVLCVYGTDETDKSICPMLKAPNVHVLGRPGGHHFDRNYGPIEDAILSQAK